MYIYRVVQKVVAQPYFAITSVNLHRLYFNHLFTVVFMRHTFVVEKVKIMVTEVIAKKLGYRFLDNSALCRLIVYYTVRNISL